MRSDRPTKNTPIELSSVPDAAPDSSRDEIKHVPFPSSSQSTPTPPFGEAIHDAITQVAYKVLTEKEAKNFISGIRIKTSSIGRVSFTLPVTKPIKNSQNPFDITPDAYVLLRYMLADLPQISAIQTNSIIIYGLQKCALTVMSKMPTAKEKETAEAKGQPILVKQQDRFIIYGRTNNRWAATSIPFTHLWQNEQDKLEKVVSEKEIMDEALLTTLRMGHICSHLPLPEDFSRRLEETLSNLKNTANSIETLTKKTASLSQMPAIQNPEEAKLCDYLAARKLLNEIDTLWENAVSLPQRLAHALGISISHLQLARSASPLRAGIEQAKEKITQTRISLAIPLLEKATSLEQITQLLKKNASDDKDLAFKYRHYKNKRQSLYDIYSYLGGDHEKSLENIKKILEEIEAHLKAIKSLASEAPGAEEQFVRPTENKEHSPAVDINMESRFDSITASKSPTPTTSTPTSERLDLSPLEIKGIDSSTQDNSFASNPTQTRLKRGPSSPPTSTSLITPPASGQNNSFENPQFNSTISDKRIISLMTQNQTPVVDLATHISVSFKKDSPNTPKTPQSFSSPINSTHLVTEPGSPTVLPTITDDVEVDNDNRPGTFDPSPEPTEELPSDINADPDQNEIQRLKEERTAKGDSLELTTPSSPVSPAQPSPILPTGSETTFPDSELSVPASNTIAKVKNEAGTEHSDSENNTGMGSPESSPLNSSHPLSHSTSPDTSSPTSSGKTKTTAPDNISEEREEKKKENSEASPGPENTNSSNDQPPATSSINQPTEEEEEEEEENSLAETTSNNGAGLSQYTTLLSPIQNQTDSRLIIADTARDEAGEKKREEEQSNLDNNIDKEFSSSDPQETSQNNNVLESSTSPSSDSSQPLSPSTSGHAISTFPNQLFTQPQKEEEKEESDLPEDNGSTSPLFQGRSLTSPTGTAPLTPDRDHQDPPPLQPPLPSPRSANPQQACSHTFFPSPSGSRSTSPTGTQEMKINVDHGSPTELLELTSHYRKLTYLSFHSHYEFKKCKENEMIYAHLLTQLADKKIEESVLKKYSFPSIEVAQKETINDGSTSSPKTIYLFGVHCQEIENETDQITNTVASTLSDNKKLPLEPDRRTSAPTLGTDQARIIKLDLDGTNAASVERWRQEEKTGKKTFISQSHIDPSLSDIHTLMAWAAASVSRFFAAAPPGTKAVKLEDGYRPEQLAALISYCDFMGLTYRVGEKQILRLHAAQFASQAGITLTDEESRKIINYKVIPTTSNITKLTEIAENCTTDWKQWAITSASARFDYSQWEDWLNTPGVKNRYSQLLPLGAKRHGDLLDKFGLVPKSSLSATSTTRWTRPPPLNLTTLEDRGQNRELYSPKPAPPNATFYSPAPDRRLSTHLTTSLKRVSKRRPSQ